MTATGRWRRVNRRNPCPICDRADWCLLAADGSAAICARTESAKRCGEAGWIHRLRQDSWRPVRRFVRSVPLISHPSRADLAGLAAGFRAAVDPGLLGALARHLGLSVESLHALGIGWSSCHRAWSFPMTDAAGNVLGIRLRRANGFKFAVAGGKEGLFLPPSAHMTGTPLLIAEGPTDTAALLDMGFRCVAGRPSCFGGPRLLVDLVQRGKPSEVAILADADEPGRRGAENLAAALVAYVRTVRVITPPAGHKDARQWLRARGTLSDVEHIIREAPVRRLAIQSRRVGLGR